MRNLAWYGIGAGSKCKTILVSRGWRAKSSRAFLAGTDIESLQGSLCRLDAADEVQRDLDSLHSGKEELRFVESAHALVGIVSDEAYCQKVSSSSLDTIDFNEIVSLADPLSFPLLKKYRYN
jgi:hypothetical protein